ncbi:putative acetyltransferase [Prauserella shujinwangii]|uniref:Putative acetyltransferase n=1 Tax=Prauserella shujinwangii TaxID=1453103 RepID=A0A2T0LP68_9PSEU|nr:GNAT family N-acetyltransferase [Prauserella shujinwangii]PRX45051.1 putative acetyltransferase [Prauserella shujinwangii]
MSDHEIRVLADEEHRAANTLFRAAMHAPKAGAEDWALEARGYQPGRTLGAFDEELIGTAQSIDSDLTVPGGGTVPLAAVTRVGVRADRVRRGVLSGLLQRQFADFAERGTVAAALHASEGAIYGRFGYGVATTGRSYAVDRRIARLRPEVPSGGEIELLDTDTALDRLPRIYAGLERLRPGMLARPSYLWLSEEPFLRQADTPLRAAVHHGPRGADGYARYLVSRTPGSPVTARVVDFHAATAEAFAGLWRFLLGLDLVDVIETRSRPLDEPVELLFTDPRACRVTGVRDEIWLRLVDVPAALAARERDADPLVIEVSDPRLPANSGRYLITPDEVTRTDRPPEITLGADTLAMLYLGGWRPSALAAVGRLAAANADAERTADRLFRARRAPWCGTFF